MTQQDFIFISVPVQYEIMRKAAYENQMTVPEFIAWAVSDKLSSMGHKVPEGDLSGGHQTVGGRGK